MTRSSTLSLTAILALTGIAGAATPTFDDQTLGDTHLVGDVFTSDGVAVRIEPIVWMSGTTWSGGSGNITADDWAGGSGLELNTNNCTARLDFAGSIGAQPVVQVLFGDLGGNVNLTVNGDFRNTANMIDLHGLNVGGCLVEVLPLPGGRGQLIASGAISSLAIGGQEFAIDMTYGDCDIAFESVAYGMHFAPGSALPPEGGVDLYIDDFQYGDGTWTSTGFGAASAGNWACGDGLELMTNNSNLILHPTGGPIRDVQWQFGEYGGNINISVNGELRNVNNYIDLHGMTVGGCLLHVLGGDPMGNGCGEFIVLGDVHKLAIGGQEHYVDCFTWTPIATTPGDIDGDGDVDTDDLLALIAAWGTNDPTADLNNDGTVNVDDLMIVLGNYQA